MMPIYPDSILFNENSERYDASMLSYPMNVGSQKLESIKLDNSNSANVNNYFAAKFKELRDSYEKLVEEYKWNKIIYESEFSFQPKTGEVYFLYQKENKSYWLSNISPKYRNKKHIGSFKLLTNGK